MSENGSEQAAVDALHRYRVERGPEAECLIGQASALERQLPQERRREELIERAEADGLTRGFAEQIYEVAQDVGLEPAFAYELVRCGVGVRDLDEEVYGEDGADVEAEMTSAAPPAELLVPGTEAPDAAARERRLRTSFRRLRRHLEVEPDAERALRAFTAEPDVGRLAY